MSDELCLISADRSRRVLVHAVALLDAWLETMRGPDGYGGPVVHWWQDNLLYTGVGLDWRYEGIILGYLNLYRATGEERWLDKARRAGDDLVRGQLPAGNFRASCFEANPGTGGTPHEAACDRALIALAQSLRERGDPAWEVYAGAAHRNLEGYILRFLWNEEGRFFQNTPTDLTFVPNKAATTAEALMAWADLTGDPAPMEQYVFPTLDRIVAVQFRSPDHPLDGAVDQGVVGNRGMGRFFPFYIARCIPALMEGYERSGRGAYRDAARAAAGFLLRFRRPDGSFPQVVYRNGRVGETPRWVAGAGDILRALERMRRDGMNVHPEITLAWLLRGQHPHGGIATARGFSGRNGAHLPSHPDFRDLLPVCGWADKAFRYLAGQICRGDRIPEVGPLPDVEMDGEFRGVRCRYKETARWIEVRGENGWRYRWTKGAPWAEVNGKLAVFP